MSIAEGIASGDGFTIYNAESGFQKIFYPLILAPAYLFANQQITIQVIGFLNACLMSSGIIPLWLLGKKSLSSSILRLLVCFMYLVSSDMTYSMTFMSENIYVPMALWLIFFINCLFECQNTKKKVIYSVLIGLYIYTMYLTKEIALVFLIAVPMLRCMDYVYTRISGDSEESVFFADVFLECVGVLVPFLLCHILFKSTLFAGWGNSYNQMSLDVLLQDGRIRYLLYGFIYYLCTCLVVVGVLPFLLPMLQFRNLPRREKRLFTLICLMIVGTACVIAYTITIREDFGQSFQNTPRAHMRYISYVAWPLVMLFLGMIEKKCAFSRAMILKSIVLIGGFGVIFVMFWRGPYEGSAVDQTMLSYLTGIEENWLLIYCTCLTIGSIFVVASFQWRKRAICILFVLLFCGVQIVNNIKKIHIFQYDYSISSEKLADVEELNQLLSQHEDDIFIAVSENRRESRRLFDTYVRYDNVYSSAWSVIDAAQQRNNGSISFEQLECWYHGIPYGLERGDYLVLEKDNPIVLLEDKYRVVISNDHYKVYDIRSAETLPQLKDRSKVTMGENLYTPDTYWPFYSQEENGTTSTGAKTLVYGPYMTLPAGTYTFEIYYSYEGEPVAADTVVGYCDIFSGAVGLDWAQYVTPATASENVVSIEQVEFTSDIPQFELRMMTHMAGVKVEKIIIQKM